MQAIWNNLKTLQNNVNRSVFYTKRVSKSKVLLFLGRQTGSLEHGRLRRQAARTATNTAAKNNCGYTKDLTAAT